MGYGKSDLCLVLMAQAESQAESWDKYVLSHLRIFYGLIVDPKNITLSLPKVQQK